MILNSSPADIIWNSEDKNFRKIIELWRIKTSEGISQGKNPSSSSLAIAYHNTLKMDITIIHFHASKSRRKGLQSQFQLVSRFRIPNLKLLFAFIETFQILKLSLRPSLWRRFFRRLLQRLLSLENLVVDKFL